METNKPQEPQDSNELKQLEGHVERAVVTGWKAVNQYHFTVLCVLVAAALTALILFNGFANPENVAAQITAQVNSVTLFLVSFLGFCLFLMGVGGVNVYDEIVKEHNVALSVFLLGVAYGIASCISKAAL